MKLKHSNLQKYNNYVDTNFANMTQRCEGKEL